MDGIVVAASRNSAVFDVLVKFDEIALAEGIVKADLRVNGGRQVVATRGTSTRGAKGTDLAIEGTDALLALVAEVLLSGSTQRHGDGVSGARGESDRHGEGGEGVP